MYQDAYNTIRNLVESNKKVNFIAIDKLGGITISTTESLNPKMFLSIQEALEYIENL